MNCDFNLNAIAEKLKASGTETLELLLINTPAILERSHQNRTTEKLLFLLGNSHIDPKKAGCLRLIKRIDVNVMARFILKYDFLQERTSFYEQFPGIYRAFVQSKKFKEAKILAYQTSGNKFFTYTNEEVINFVFESNILSISEIKDPDLLITINFRKGLYKEIKKIFSKKTKKRKFFSDKEIFLNQYGLLSPKTASEYIANNRLANISHLYFSNLYIYSCIKNNMKMKQKKYIDYLFENNIWTKDNLTPESNRNKETVISIKEIGDIFFHKIQDDNLPVTIGLSSVDKKLATFVHNQNIFWIIKAYILIRSGLLFQPQTNYLCDWSKERFLEFLSKLDLQADSPDLPKLEEFLKNKGF